MSLFVPSVRALVNPETGGLAGLDAGQAGVEAELAQHP